MKLTVITVMISAWASMVHAGDLVVNSGQTIDLWGNQTYDSVTIHNNGVLRVPERRWKDPLFGDGYWEGGWLRIVTGDFVVEDGGWLNADGSGYSHWDYSLDPSINQGGPGVGGDSQSIASPCGGGGYGHPAPDYSPGAVSGGHVPYGASGGLAYGSATSVDSGPSGSVQMGSRGGNFFHIVNENYILSAAGGAGGGGLEITAQSMRINGTVSANGGGGIDYDGGVGSGGGSGGQIALDSRDIRIGSTGSVEANGGNSAISGAGGGGRIKIGAVTYVNDGAVSVAGGTAQNSQAHGQNGYIHQPISRKRSTDTFGSGANQFTIDFVPISGTTNPSSGYGIVNNDYRIGKYEITNDQWNKFVAEHGAPTGDPSYAYDDAPYWTGTNVPTNEVSWYEAAQFVNWLNTEAGHHVAYNFDQGGNFDKWDAAEADAENLYRHKDAFYYLPTEDEWVKAGYWNGANLQTYATTDDTVPVEDVEANYDSDPGAQPWDVGSGSEELNGTYDIMGNVWEWMESPSSDPNFGTGSNRGLRGGSYNIGDVDGLASSDRNGDYAPNYEGNSTGFRVASEVPEPASIGLLAIGGLALIRRRCQCGGRHCSE